MLLRTKDVDLYYERMGNGPTMVLVHGAIADAGYFSECCHYLRDHFDLVTYDRRGNSRSTPKEGAQFHIAQQTDDLVNLVEMLDLKDIILVGHSAGGCICMDALSRIPGRIRHMIIYETPLLGILPDRPQMEEWVENMEALNAAGKHKEVAKEFGLSIGELDERAPKKSMDEKWKDRQNFAQFINYEFHDFSYYKPDPAVLKANARYITILEGDRNRGHYFHASMQALQEMIECERYYTAGCHNAPYDIPQSFAAALLGVCAIRGLV